MLEIKQMELKDFQDAKIAMKQSMTKATEGFVEMGFILKEMRVKELYLEAGYKDIWEAAEKEFRIKRKLAWGLMNIVDKYTVGGNSMQLLPQFEGYNKSLLIEMITLPEEDYELISQNTKIEDIRELKEAEREQTKEKKDQLEGQMSLINDMPEVVPEEDKPKKEEATIQDALREMFRPREMKEYLDNLVNMNPDSQAMEWWVGDFNQTGYRKFSKKPFFLYFYGREEGLKLKDVKSGEVVTHTYKDFYFMVRAAFAKETASGTDVWNQAFGAEYEAEMQRQKEEEKRKKEFQKQKEEKQRKVKENQEKTESKKPEKAVSEEKEGENGAVLKKNAGSGDLEEEKYKDSVNEVEGNKDIVSEKEESVKKEDQKEPETEVKDKPTEEQSEEKAEVVEGEVENTVCDIAQDWRYANKKELSRNTYNEIVTGKRRHLVLELELREGSKVRLTSFGIEKEIRVVVTVVDEIMGSALNAYGFEVISIGKEK